MTTKSLDPFYQVNTEMAENFIKQPLTLLELKEMTWVIDAYSGIGTIAIFLLQGNMSKVYGVEVISEAVLRIAKNAQLNNISNANYVCDS